MRTASLALRSPAILAASQSFSAWVEEGRLLPACRSSRSRRATPSTIVGRPSAMNMICQPLRPNRPSQAHQAGRDRRADRHRDRQADQEARDDAGMVAGREPVGEIEDQAGKEAGLAHAEQEAHDGEAGRAGDEGGGRRRRCPR